MRSVLCASSLCLAASVASPAAASTWIVDVNGGPGTNFTAIQPAIAASAPGDVLLVMPGQYSSFILDRGLSILAQGSGVLVSGYNFVNALPAGEVASLVGLFFNQGDGYGLKIQNCAGTVIGDGLSFYSRIWVTGSSDVRLRRVISQFSSGSPLLVTASRLELVDSSLAGGSGSPLICQDFGQAGPGGTALIVQSGEVHVARSNLFGGPGGPATCGDLGLCGADGGDGGSGLFLYPGATALVTGLPVHTIQGGPGGSACSPGYPGGVGAGLSIGSGASAQVSGATISSIVNLGGTLGFAIPDDPTMHILETPTPGGNLTFRISAQPGATVDLVVGRLVVQSTPGIDEDVLATPDRVYPLGTVPGSGVIGKNYRLRPIWPKGFTIVFQAVVTLPGGTIQRTHSIPVVLR